MSDRLAITEEEVLGLEALARAELRLALSFSERAEQAEDPQAATDYARTAQRSGRGYRQILALKVRLGRELKRQAREDRSDERGEHQRAVSERKARVRAAVKGLIWTEREDEAAERLEDDLDDLLGDDALAPDFLDVPLDHLVARLRHDLGLSPPVDPGDGADPPQPAPPRAGGDPSGLSAESQLALESSA